MDYWETAARLDDDYLEGLDYLGIQGLIGQVQKEVQEKSEEVFGVNGSSGLFGTWIGKAPLPTGAGGSGELGRLLREYYSWSDKQALGIALMAAPLWEKPLWDSRGSFFSAPSLRTVVDIGIAVAAAAASVYTGGASLGLIALTLVDDAVFTVLDVAGGYKTFDEAGFAFGQKALITFATSAIGSAFQSLQTIAAGINGFKGVVAQTALTGAQALTTGTVTSALSAVTYNSRDGFGWSTEAFSAGMRSTLVSAASSMTSTFTSGSLALINSGAGMEKLKGFSLANMKDVSSLNRTIGGLAGQGVNYALTGEFTLNIASAYNTGLLELHLGNQGIGMNLGTGGLNTSFQAIASAIQGAAVWGTNDMINSYTSANDLDIAVALRSQYGFGDETQKDQLWDILSGKTDIVVKDLSELEESQRYEALTLVENGKRVIYLGNYKEGMTVSEQMRLGALLGHEAYRDGLADDDFDELKTASIARILMGNRINLDYTWFYEQNFDFGFESYLLSQTGGDEIFDDYLQSLYRNDMDYYWKWITADQDKQNKLQEYKTVPLLNVLSQEKVDAINKESLDRAVEKYKDILKTKDDYEGNKSLFPDGKTDEEIKTYILGDKILQEELNYTAELFYSLFNYGCVLFSSMYGAEALTGNDLDPVKVNELAKLNKLFVNGGELSNALMADIMSVLSGGEYKVELVFSKQGVPSILELLNYEQSKEMYFSHLRVKTEYLMHSEMVAGIGYEMNAGYRTGVKYIDTANSWGGNGETALSMTRITPNMVARWDTFKATPTYLYYLGNYQRATQTYSR
jgi:hypothetical protein